MHVHRTMYLERTGILFIVFLLLIWQVNQVLVASTTDDDLADLRIRMAIYCMYVHMMIAAYCTVHGGCMWLINGLGVSSPSYCMRSAVPGSVHAVR